jgi:putative serine protease PepD
MQPSSFTRFTITVIVGVAVLAGGIAIGATSTRPGETASFSDRGAPAAMALESNFVSVAKEVNRSVVEIDSRTSLGSGVIFDSLGDVVTNAHVVGNAKSFVVSLSNGQRRSARLVGTYVPDDLAVVRVSPTTGLVPAAFANSGGIEVGDIVLAIGSPLGLSDSVTEGIVSFNGRSLVDADGVSLRNLVQTSAPINPGNSGGALVNVSGQVIGLPTLVATSPKSGVASTGLGFAIPSDTVEVVAAQLIADGRVLKSRA